MRVRKLMLATALAALVISAGHLMSTSAARAATNNDTANRLSAAANVLNEIMATPDKGIPQDLLDKAACAVVVPNVKKGAFIVGAKYGRGFIVCRNQNGRGWSAPAGVKVEGGSVGFQIGGSETDVVMLLMNKSAIDKLLSSKFTIGADASVAAGAARPSPSGRTAGPPPPPLRPFPRSQGIFPTVPLVACALVPRSAA